MTPGTTPEAQRARHAVQRARRRGELVYQDCEYAESGECRGRIEAHHEDYERPLDVRFLCKRHHAIVHHFDRIYAALDAAESQRASMAAQRAVA